MWNDFRTAFRSLRRAPVFAGVSVLTLALAIGSAAAVFSVVDAVFIRGLPYRDTGRLRTIYEQSETGGYRVPSFPTYLDWQSQAGALRGTIDGFAFIRGDGVMLDNPEGRERSIAAFVTPGFFALMGTQPELGRTFLPDDELPGSPRVAVISHEYFVKRFNGSPSSIGETISIDSVPTRVIGVMPRGFAFPNFAADGYWMPPTLWQPIAVFQATKPALTKRSLHVDSRALIRINEHADPAGAVAAMRTIEQRLAAEYPVDQARWTAVFTRSLADEMFGPLSTTLLMIGGAIGLVLLLACVNTANLMLVRTSVRAKDLAVRTALGAGAWRLAQHQLTEVVIIAALSGAGAVGLGQLFVGALRPYAAQRLPFSGSIHVDGRSLAFVVALVVLVIMLVALLPVMQTLRGSPVARLRAGSTSRAQGVGERRTRDVLATTQMALAIAVLIAAGLLIQSLRRISGVQLGYDPDALEFAISPPAHRYDAPADAAALYKRIMDATSAIPSVEGVAATGGALIPTRVETAVQHSSTAPDALYHPVSANYFDLFRIRVVAGRGFNDQDVRAPAGFVVTENLARKLWPSGTAIGQRITVRRQSQARADVGQPITLPVIGVVADHRAAGATNDPPMQVFLPYTLEVWPWMTFAVRGPQTAAVAAQVDRAIHEVDPGITYLGEKPTPRVESLSRRLSDPRVFVMSLMTTFGAIALFLAAIGLYGVVAYGVTQRTYEFGLRMAIGATSADIRRLVMRHVALLVVAGVVVGVAVGAAGARVVRSMLFDTNVNDVATLVAVPLLLVIVAALASMLPARRASRVDPIIAIRGDS
jgi:predicted permease